jgi:hypothetical protein
MPTSLVIFLVLVAIGLVGYLFWTGAQPLEAPQPSEASDIKAYLADYTAEDEAYPATEFYLVVCPCGSDRYRLLRAGSITRRTCENCGQVRYVCRDGDPIHWEEASDIEVLQPYQCLECKAAAAHLCLGFARNPENPELDSIKWFYLGATCCQCGAHCCFSDGKVNRGPMSRVLFSQVAGEPQADAE